MSCPKCGYCEHCGRSNFVSYQQFYYQQYPYGVTYQSATGQVGGNQTVGPGLMNSQPISQILQQQQAACEHPQQEKKDAPISR